MAQGLTAHGPVMASDEAAEACRGLWLAVLLQGLEDAQLGEGAGWPGSRAYYTVASLAGLDLDAAGDLARRATGPRPAIPPPASGHSPRQPSQRRKRKAHAPA